MLVPAPDRTLQAYGGGDQTVVLGRSGPDVAQRFTVARALWSLLYAPDRPYLVTAGQAWRQKVERAFAAELLAPAEGLAEVLGGELGLISMEELEEAEQHFNVSSLVIQNQIENQLSGV
jgi:Zn-dependent peptidase ImmA (M78 family)